MGIYQTQEIYFQSWVIGIPLPGTDFRIPLLPGGHLVSTVLLINLITGFFARFSWKVKKWGLMLIHLGILVLLAGQMACEITSVESRMTIREGESINYSENLRQVELAIIETSPNDPNARLDNVYCITEHRLEDRGSITLPSLSDGAEISVTVLDWLPHSNPVNRKSVTTPPYPGIQGAGQFVQVTPLPPVTAMDAIDMPSAWIEVFVDGNSQGTWLVSRAIGMPQSFRVGDKVYHIGLRPERYYKPYTIKLLDFTHEQYAGSDIPKNFNSRIQLTDPALAEKRLVDIYMNHPLRYRGETFFQAGYADRDTTTILQVVQNSFWQIPYLSCALVSLGMIHQFLLNFLKFIQRNRSQA